MTHTVEVVRYEKLSNGQVAFVLRCCGNASTDHTHTMAVSVASDPTSREASLAQIRDFVSKQHNDSVKAEQSAFDEIGNVSTHDHI